MAIDALSFGEPHKEFFENITVEQTVEQAETWCVNDAMNRNLSPLIDEEIYLIEESITVVYNEADNTIVVNGKYIDPDEGEIEHKIEYICKKYSMPPSSKFVRDHKWTSLSL